MSAENQNSVTQICGTLNYFEENWKIKKKIILRLKKSALLRAFQ